MPPGWWLWPVCLPVLGLCILFPSISLSPSVCVGCGMLRSATLLAFGPCCLQSVLILSGRVSFLPGSVHWTVPLSVVQFWWHPLVWLPAVGVCLHCWPVVGLCSCLACGTVYYCALTWPFLSGLQGRGPGSSVALSLFWAGSRAFFSPFSLGLSSSPVWAGHFSG